MSPTQNNCNNIETCKFSNNVTQAKESVFGGFSNLHITKINDLEFISGTNKLVKLVTYFIGSKVTSLVNTVPLFRHTYNGKFVLFKVVNWETGCMNGNIPAESIRIIENIMSRFFQAYRIEIVIQIHTSTSFF